MDDRRSLGLLLAWAVASAILIGGCTDEDRAEFRVINRLSEPIEVVYLHGDTRIVLDEVLEPGLNLPVNSFVGRGECVDDKIIALDQSGTVVATFAGPVCDGTVWEVTPTF